MKKEEFVATSTAATHWVPTPNASHRHLALVPLIKSSRGGSRLIRPKLEQNQPTNFLNKANYSPKQSSQQTLGTCSNLLCSKMSGNAVPPSDEGQLTARSDRQHQQRERCGFPIRTSARQHLVTFGAVVRHRECLPQTHITTQSHTRQLAAQRSAASRGSPKTANRWLCAL